VDPVPDPLLLRKSGTAGNRTRTPGSVAKNSDARPQRRLNNTNPDKNISVSVLKVRYSRGADSTSDRHQP
jgi:hypothetical protein